MCRILVLALIIVMALSTVSMANNLSPADAKFIFSGDQQVAVATIADAEMLSTQGQQLGDLLGLVLGLIGPILQLVDELVLHGLLGVPLPTP